MTILADQSEGDSIHVMVELTQDTRLMPSPAGAYVQVGGTVINENDSMNLVFLELEPTMYMRRLQGKTITEDSARVTVDGWLSKRLDDGTPVIVVKHMSHLAGTAPVKFASIGQMLEEHDTLEKVRTAIPPTPTRRTSSWGPTDVAVGPDSLD